MLIEEHVCEKNAYGSDFHWTIDFCCRWRAFRRNRRRFRRILYSRTGIRSAAWAILRGRYHRSDYAEARPDPSYSPYVLSLGIRLDRHGHSGGLGGWTHSSRKLGAAQHRFYKDRRRQP